MIYLKKGDSDESNNIAIIDEDRLCFQVLSTNHGGKGIRTISKALLEEFIDYFNEHPNSSAQAAREDLSGRSDIDKFEYGYNATLRALSLLNKTLSNRKLPPKNVPLFVLPLQQIFYGAPGTGKSHGIEKLTEDESVIRTTFHPDSDYSSFVGAYKPTTKEVILRDSSGQKIVEDGEAVTEDRIVYEYVEQAFLKAYVKAWQLYAENPDEPQKQFLIIEEINRGNCAQIFGDLFQLLDRNDEGFSSYEITPDSDIKRFIMKQKLNVSDIYNATLTINISEKINNGDVLALPPNLYIWATMNTSDQSLFPIDSAFKRRWDWKYVPIDTRKEDWAIVANGNKYVWGSFLEKINEEIGETTSSEDKKLGFYFCKAKDGEISAERFVSKVLFYVYNDVFKDYGFEREFFKNENGKTMAFQSFYNVDGSVNEAQVEKILKTLKVDLAETEENEVSKDEEQTLIEEGRSTGGGKHDLISSITIDGENFSKDKMTHFEMYMNTLKKIGIDRVAPIIESCKYKRLKCDLATKTPNETILNSKYEYVKEGEYYFVKGAADETLINVLKVVKEALKLNLEIEIYN